MDGTDDDGFFHVLCKHGHGWMSVATCANRANAELIVRAVNSHAALVEACEALILHFPGTKDPSNLLALEQARAALTLAKEQS